MTSRAWLVAEMKNNLSWPDVVFHAEAEREEFSDVQIITLYSHCLNLAEEMGVSLPSIIQSALTYAGCFLSIEDHSWMWGISQQSAICLALAAVWTL